MKHTHFITVLTTVALFLCISISMHAQPNNWGNGWKERMESEKIAFLTTEIGLTPDEAQKFWPIYNQVSEQLDKAMLETFTSYMELEKALDAKKSEKEIGKLLEKYLDALDSQDKIRSNSVNEYKKIMTDTKVAKIFVAEEKFRRQNIRRLHHNPARPQ